LAAGFRLTGLDLGWFMVDQARDAVEALKIAEGRSFPLVGPIAPGLYAMGPLYYYLLAVPFWFSKDPSAAVFFIGLLNLVSVYLTYRLGREFFSPTVGLVGAALYAVFPMAVISSKAMWNPGFIPFFTVVFFYFLYRFLVGQRPWGLTFALVALGCLLQVHLGGFALLLLLLITLLLFRPPFPWRHALAGSVLALVLFFPYVTFEARQGFQGLSDALRFLRQDREVMVRESQIEMPWRALQAPFTIPVRMAEGFALASLSFFKPVQHLELALFLGGFFWLFLLAVRRWWRGGEVLESHALLILWIVVPVLVLSQKKQALMWYYFDLLYPSQFLAVGIIIDEVLQAIARRKISGPLRRVTSSMAALTLGLIVFSQASFLEALRQDVLGSGVLRLPTEIGLRFPDPLWWIRERGFLELMPVRYKRELTAALLADSSMDEAAFHLRVHGSAFEDLIEDKGYFFHILQREGVKGGGEIHALVVRERNWPGGIEGTSKKVGPFRVARYQPSIRYVSWKHSKEPGPSWFARGFDDSSWTPTRLPARNLPDRSIYAQTPLVFWGGSPVYYRGWIEGGEENLYLVIALRDLPLEEHRHRIGAFYLNGRRLEPLRVHSYLTPLTRSTEVIFKVGCFLEPGPNLMAFQVTGTFPAFDLDVYEVRWKGRGGDDAA